jgi:hypothetical protein
MQIRTLSAAILSHCLLSACLPMPRAGQSSELARFDSEPLSSEQIHDRAEACRKLRSSHNTYSAASAATAVLAGAGGLSTIPISDDNGKLGIAISALVVGAASAFLTSKTASKARDYAEDKCPEFIVRDTAAATPSPNP